MKIPFIVPPWQSIPTEEGALKCSSSPTFATVAPIAAAPDPVVIVHPLFGSNGISIQGLNSLPPPPLVGFFGGIVRDCGGVSGGVVRGIM